MHSLTRPNIVSVGTIVWLSSELMFFAGLFAMYFTVRSVHRGDWPMTLPDGDVPIKLQRRATRCRSRSSWWPSSFTCQWGVFAAEKGDVFKLRRWFVITFFMGLIFVLGQANEYRMQVHDGNTISATGYGSVFFLTTGFHGLHVIGGLIAFIFFLIRTDAGQVHAGPGHRGDRRVVLLALRRRRVDRPVRRRSTSSDEHPDADAPRRRTGTTR